MKDCLPQGSMGRLHKAYTNLQYFAGAPIEDNHASVKSGQYSDSIMYLFS